MDNIKMIATDMDGTLLNNDRKVSPRNIELLNEAAESGIKICAATGRDFREASAPLKEASLFLPVIGANGAEIRFADGSLFDEKTLDNSLFSLITDPLKREQVYYEVYTNLGAFTTNKEEGLKLVLDVLASTGSKMPKEEALALAEKRFEEGNVQLTRNYETLLAEEKTKLLKILAFSASEKIRRRIRSELAELPVDISSSAMENLEITHHEATKGRGVQSLAGHYGIKLSEVMVIGDNENDLSMMDAAGYAVAMANAAESVKQRADIITGTNYESGVAQAVERVLEARKASLKKSL
ncbi:Cof-type HAD-IIB family hydrolase [Alkalicoccus halolimnae]|uniref:Cof-type HAD-IIB family hydrolase n=1 Tax=Alkalicoccus halolimnae TaxID=1667239 RepID=A0A5C7F4M3_9BACI|nr:Cof-type HAD-IIB family hydrolase [Alkalicoccus halolimnae]TXF83066.1 HAD family phosphatase [Alkalicoccus halolimnae]